MKYTNISISVYAYKCRCVCICYARRHIKITQPAPLLAFYALPVVSMHTASISELLKEKYARCRRRFYRAFAFSHSLSLSLHHNHLQNRRATCAYSVKYQPHNPPPPGPVHPFGNKNPFGNGMRKTNSCAMYLSASIWKNLIKIQSVRGVRVARGFQSARTRALPEDDDAIRRSEAEHTVACLP